MVACVKSQKIDWIPLRLAIWNIIIYPMQLQQNRTRWLNATYFSYNNSSTNKYANLPRRRAIAGRRTVGLLLVLNDAHNPINNPTVRIVGPRKQHTLLSGSYTTDRRTIIHHNGDVCSYPNDTPFWQCFFRGIMVGALFCPICQIFPVWFHRTMFRSLCCFRLATVLENCHSDT